MYNFFHNYIEIAKSSAYAFKPFVLVILTRRKPYFLVPSDPKNQTNGF